MELTDRQVSALCIDLRISTEDYKLIINCNGDSSTLNYALKIARVRKVLDMSMDMQEVCYDYVAPKE